MMDELKQMADLPIRDGKPELDVDSFPTYSIELLGAIANEMRRCIDDLPGALACPAPSADEVANKNWVNNIDRERVFYQEILRNVNEELSRRWWSNAAHCDEI